MTISSLGCQRAAGQYERAGAACHRRGGAAVRAVDVHRTLALNGERCTFGNADALVERERLAVSEHERYVARHGDGFAVGQSSGGHCIGAVTPSGGGIIERNGSFCRLLHGDALHSVARTRGNVQRDGLTLNIVERGLARQQGAAVAVGHADSSLSRCGRMGDLCHGICYLIHGMHNLRPVTFVLAAAAVIVIEHIIQPVIERDIFSEGQRAADACTGCAGTTVDRPTAKATSCTICGCHRSTIYGEIATDCCIAITSLTVIATTANAATVTACGCQCSTVHDDRAVDSCTTVSSCLITFAISNTLTVATFGCQRAAGQNERTVACHSRSSAVVRAVDCHCAFATDIEGSSIT